jgi:hypothetical protein
VREPQRLSFSTYEVGAILSYSPHCRSQIRHCPGVRNVGPQQASGIQSGEVTVDCKQGHDPLGTWPQDYPARLKVSSDRPETVKTGLRQRVVHGLLKQRRPRSDTEPKSMSSSRRIPWGKRRLARSVIPFGAGGGSGQHATKCRTGRGWRV